MRRTTTLVIALSMAVSGLSLLPAAPAVAAGALSTAQPTLVSADPADWTPNIQDGQVNAIVQVGNQVIVGGQFLQAKNISGNLLDVSSILAFDATTGTINKHFMPTFDGEILALGTDGTSVYVGGRFATVNGQTGYKRLVKLDPANGQIVTPFKAKIGAGEAVHDLSFANGKLYIGGAFSAVQGVAREKFAALNPVSGALDPTVDVAFTGKHNGGTGRIRKFDITPDGTKMVAVGNFTLVDGQDRDQVAMVDLTTDTVANWQTNRFKSACSSFFDTYMQRRRLLPRRLLLRDRHHRRLHGRRERRGAVRHDVALGDQRHRHGPAAHVGRLHRRGHHLQRDRHRHGGLRRRSPALVEQPVLGQRRLRGTRGRSIAWASPRSTR